MGDITNPRLIVAKGFLFLLLGLIAGAMLIIVGPVEPALDRLYIGRTFAIVVLAGLGSMTGTLGAGLILGISESIVLMMLGASWAPAVAFGLLLLVLGIRPQGLFGR
jgi:branched-chain amino acid transport system permease protein